MPLALPSKYVLLAGSLLFIAAGCGASYDQPAAARPLKGNPESKVLLEEFSDFQCPACGAAFPVVKRLVDRYGERLQFRYRHFPLSQIHAFAKQAAIASECANDQGKFWEYHDQLFANQEHLTKGDLRSYAVSVGLDEPAFRQCLDARGRADAVEADLAEGNRRQVRGTPTFYLDGKLIENWTVDLEKAIQEAVGPFDPLVNLNANQPAVPSGNGNVNADDGSASR